MLEDMGKLPWIKEIIDSARSVTKYKYNHTFVLSIMRQFTGNRELVRPAITRFSTSFISLQSLLNSMLELQRMFISNEWVELYYQIATLPGAWEAVLALIKANIDLFGVRTEVYNTIVDRLATITVPTLVFWGRQDRILPVAHAQVASKGLPSARIHIFDRCCHWPQVERLEELNTFVLDFLA